MTMAHEFGDTGEITFVCDGKGCSDYFDTGESELEPALRELWAKGWLVRRIEGEWQHLCRDCRFVVHQSSCR